MSETVIENLLRQILSEISAVKLSRSTWLTVDELSAYIGLKPSTIHQYVHEDRIPFRKIPTSRKLIFLRKEIDAWIINKNGHSRVEKAQAEANRIWQQTR